jgi:hypothetical protein
MGRYEGTIVRLSNVNWSDPLASRQIWSHQYALNLAILFFSFISALGVGDINRNLILIYILAMEQWRS